MKTSDIINYEKFGFDGAKYIEVQSKAIEDRISKFSGRLYLEIGGKFMYDPHAARVLPGFLVDSKKIIFSQFKEKAEIIFCLNAIDLNTNRQLSNENTNYGDYCISMISEIESNIGIKPKISINRVRSDNMEKSKIFKERLESIGYKAYLRNEILGYPDNTKKVLSSEGYGSDEYIEVEKDLILVTGAASSSGKMSTCLGQIYNEFTFGLDSGYAKYETFPIWNLDIDHPVNLAYEAATADIGDYNEIDKYHLENYNEKSVNYNRDVEAFEIVEDLSSGFLPENNFTRNYKSPTDMGISNAGFCISNDDIVKKASIEEIDRRIEWYKEVINRGEGDTVWIERCEKLFERIKKT